MEKITTLFEPAEINLSQKIKSIDDIIVELNKCKETAIKEGLCIDWRYLSFEQLLDDRQLSVDIAMSIMEIHAQTKGMKEIKSIMLIVEKNDFFYSKRAIYAALKKLVEGYSV